MQAIYKDEVEGFASRRTDSISPFLYAGKISRYLKRKCYERAGDRRDKIQISRRIFGRDKKRIQRGK